MAGLSRYLYKTSSDYAQVAMPSLALHYLRQTESLARRYVKSRTSGCHYKSMLGMWQKHDVARKGDMQHDFIGALPLTVQRREDVAYVAACGFLGTHRSIMFNEGSNSIPWQWTRGIHSSSSSCSATSSATSPASASASASTSTSTCRSLSLSRWRLWRFRLTLG